MPTFHSLINAGTQKSESPICIAGMHRSGTSMVAQLLQLCGLFLGPEKELGFDSNNGELHFENVRFVALNDKILSRLGGSWNNPPEFHAGWELTPEVAALTTEAEQTINRFSSQRLWGWKDPRNSLTLPFWQRIVPKLKLVICLRNPLEVAHSLRKRGDLIGIPLFQLWLTYYRELVASIPSQQQVVTHYESYFQNPTAELQRVANRIGMQVSAEVASHACAHISGEFRHHRISTAELAALNVPDEVLAMYGKLCREAGTIYRQQSEYESMSMV